MSEKNNEAPASNKEDNTIQKQIYLNKLVLLGDVYVGKTSIALRY